MIFKQNPLEQFIFLYKDYKRQCGVKKLKMLYLWMTRASVGVILYRIERVMFLIFGNTWKILRILLLPILYPLYAYSNLEIPYNANIGPGISVLHPAAGVVISAHAVIGENLTLTGGNIIGGKPNVITEKFILGNNVNLGANAVIIGPVILGNNIIIGASSMVNKDFSSDSILVGVPAKKLI